jgi:uncharacterized protein YbaA (DUF1428 family)
VSVRGVGWVVVRRVNIKWRQMASTAASIIREEGKEMERSCFVVDVPLM